MNNTTSKIEALKRRLKWRFGIRLLAANRSYFRMTVLGLFVLVMTFMLPKSLVKEYDYEVGHTWQENDLTAPFDFPMLKSPEELAQEKTAVEETWPEVFVISAQSEARHRERLEKFFDDAAKWSAQLSGDPSSRDAAQTKLQAMQPANVADLLPEVARTDPGLAMVRRQALAIYDTIMRRGLVDKRLPEIKSPFVSMRTAPNFEVLRSVRQVFDNHSSQVYMSERLHNFPPAQAKLVKEALFLHCQPNYLHNEQLFRDEVESALRTVLPYYGKVEKGDVLVRQGDVITEDVALKIRSLTQEKLYNKGYTTDYVYYKTLGHFVIVSLLTLITVLFLKLNRSRLYYRRRKFLLLFMIYLGMTLLVVAVQNIADNMTTSYDVNLHYIVPFCMAPIMITVFFDDRVGFFSNVMIAVLASVVNQSSFEFCFIQLVVGSLTVFSLSRLKRRSQFFTTAGITMGAYVCSYLGYQFYLKGNIEQVNFYNIFLFAINVAFSLGTYPLIYFIERIFKITSDLTFMELLEADHPLLKQLVLKAPGTYQHSLQVANIAEEVAKKVGANPIEVHVGALFHDIGKMVEPEYFTENQRTDRNPHDALEPRESARVIINHVIYGVELAREYRLPDEIVDYIRTHHGYSRVEYFYRQYKHDHPEMTPEEERAFRYPGPLPRSKEQAIVMIADSVEAAARSLEHPSTEDLERLVEQIVAAKINDGQLNDAHITFKDVTQIKLQLVTLLQSIHHTRIKYPDAEPVRKMLA